jgi:hypothetical protein
MALLAFILNQQAPFIQHLRSQPEAGKYQFPAAALVEPAMVQVWGLK